MVNKIAISDFRHHKEHLRCRRTVALLHFILSLLFLFLVRSERTGQLSNTDVFTCFAFIKGAFD